MENSGDISRYVKRQIKDSTEFLVGTVISERVMRSVDASISGGNVWVVSVDIGQTRFMSKVLIREHNGGRAYADPGRAVLMKKMAGGRFVIIGPADKVTGDATITEYDMATELADSQTSRGYKHDKVPFEFYQGIGGDSYWNDGIHPFPLTRIVDANGDPV